MHEQTRIFALLELTLDQPAEDRRAFVLKQSADRALADEVLKALEELEGLGDFLERPAVIQWIDVRELAGDHVRSSPLR